MMEDPDMNTLDASLARNGGRAFPSAIPAKGRTVHAPGMSLRDWFAGQALAGMCANSEWVNDFNYSNSIECTAERAYSMADAMLAARAKEPGA